MVKILMPLAVILFLAAPAWPQTESTPIYSPRGRYLGYIEEDGSIYTPNGRYQGYIDSKGDIYRKNGRYAGSVPVPATKERFEFTLPLDEKKKP